MSKDRDADVGKRHMRQNVKDESRDKVDGDKAWNRRVMPDGQA